MRLTPTFLGVLMETLLLIGFFIFLYHKKYSIEYFSSETSDNIINSLLSNKQNSESKKKKFNNSFDENNKDLLINNTIKDLPCKFIGSYSEKPMCPIGYQYYSGGSIGVNGASISCSGDLLSNDTCKAVAHVKYGGVSQIDIIHPGNNYTTTPKVSIIGNGELAKAIAIIGKNKKVTEILIKNPGKNYTSSPEIVISPPGGFVYCHLCCKKNINHL